MRLSKSFWQTLKETPSDAEIASHRLSLRAGLISKGASGLYNLMPMGMRVVSKIEKIIRTELSKIDSEEISMSFVTPSELWKESGRWETMGKEMIRFSDRKENEFCLSPTNEEAVVDIFRKSITSYKNLPVNLYQIKLKVRDEIRPRFGLMRCKEFIMKDAYSFSINKNSLDEEYENYFKAYSSIFEKMGLKFSAVEADGGNMANGDAKTHEFQVIANSGEDLIVYSEETGYAANIEKAQSLREELMFLSLKDIKEVKTENMSTCEEVAKFLDIPVYQTLKTLVFTARFKTKEVHYIILILGDDNINEVKLKNFLNADELTPSTQAVLDDLGLVKGYMSPYKLSDKLNILIDNSVSEEASYVVGANKENFHISGFNPKRDLEKFKKTDLRMAKEGDLTLDKKGKISFKRGIEVGHIFQLGDKYTKSMNAHVLDQNGKKVFPLMGCYGIGVTRAMASAIEQYHDENGIIWPKSIAPYEVYLAKIGKKDETIKMCDEVYSLLKSSGIEVLYDDRGMGPGPMFKDADLLGLPIRVLLGERDYEKDGLLEIKVRSSGEVKKVKIEELKEAVLGILNEAN